jgi:hypothetical protein
VRALLFVFSADVCIVPEFQQFGSISDQFRFSETANIDFNAIAPIHAKPGYQSHG